MMRSLEVWIFWDWNSSSTKSSGTLASWGALTTLWIEDCCFTSASVSGFEAGKGKEKIGASFLKSFPEASPDNWAHMLARLGHEASCIIQEAGIFPRVHYSSAVAAFFGVQERGERLWSRQLAVGPGRWWKVYISICNQKKALCIWSH